MRPVPTCVASRPERTRSRYWSAPPAADPPGTIRLKAFPTIWAVATPNHFPVRNAMRCRLHAQAKLATSARSITANQAGLRVRSCGEDEKTFARLGHTT